MTTYISGMLTDLSEDLVRYLYWVYDHFVRRRHRRLLALLGIWVGYVSGAALGAVGRRLFGMPALVLPLAGLVFLVGFDLVRPLSTPQERGGPGAGPM